MPFLNAKINFRIYFQRQYCHNFQQEVSRMKKKTKTLLICLAIPISVGAVSGWLTRNSMDTFKLLDKPPLAPPGWVFPVAWTILYVLMGIASYLVCTAQRSECRGDGLIVYAAQLAAHVFWPLFFFLGPWYCFSLVWMVLLWMSLLHIRRCRRPLKLVYSVSSFLLQ